MNVQNYRRQAHVLPRLRLQLSDRGDWNVTFHQEREN